MKLNEVRVKDYQSKQLLNESWQLLTEAQQIYVGRWESNVWPLMEQFNKLLEAELTPDQIQQIFQNAEKVSIEGGKNLTALGKAGKVTAEVSNKIKAEIEKLADQAQKSGPVKNMDQQFEKLRAQLKQSLQGKPAGQKILAGVDKWKTFAQENPGKSAFIIGAMTSLLAFASGGVMSGAAIGFFLKLANNTIKGDSLSTAVGKSVKGAALGAVAGAIGDVVSDNIEVTPPAEKGGAVEVEVSVDSKEVADAAEKDSSALFADMTEEEHRLKYAERIADRLENVNGGVKDVMIQKIADNLILTGSYPDDFNTKFAGTFVRGNIYLTPEELAQWERVVNPSDPFAPNGTLGQETTQWLRDNVEGVEEQLAAEEAERAARLEKMKADYEAMSAEEQKAYDDKQRQAYSDFIGDPDEYTPPGEPKYTQESLEEHLWTAFEAYELQEAPKIGAALAGAAKGIGKVAAKGAEKIGQAAVKGAKAAGKELGQQVTANKLMRLWKKAGKPTDTGSITNILQQAGMDDEQIGVVGSNNNVDLKSKTVNTPKDTAEPAAKGAPAAKATPAVDLKGLVNDIKAAGLQDAVKAYLASIAKNAPAKNAADTDYYEKVKGSMRKMKATGTKPVPPKFADKVSKEIGLLAKGNKDYGARAASTILNLGSKGYDVSKLQQQWQATAKSAERLLTQSVYYYVTNLLKEHGLDWSDLGLKITLIESRNNKKLIAVSEI